MFVYSQKDIVLVPFPFTDLQSQKRRPVLVVSCNQINGTDSVEDFIGVALTTTLRRTNYSVEIQKGDYENGQLPSTSEVQCSKIAALCKNLVLKRLCTVKDEKFHDIKEVVLKAIGAESEHATRIP